MAEYIKNNVQLQILAAFIFMPLMIWAVGDYPQRTLLKESLSVVTIVAFNLIIGLFYLARTNKNVMKGIKFSKLTGLHKFVGYVAVPVLLLHPLLLVVPRFYEAGIEPLDAFTTMLTTFTSQGVIFGLIAWSSMLLIGVTSVLRKKLPMKYQSWRVVHGGLAILCIFSAAFHVIDLGRHIDFAMTMFIVLLSVGGIYKLLKTYISQGKKLEEKS